MSKYIYKEYDIYDEIYDIREFDSKQELIDFIKDYYEDEDFIITLNNDEIIAVSIIDKNDPIPFTRGKVEGLEKGDFLDYEETIIKLKESSK